MSRKELIGFIMYLLEELQQEIIEDDVDAIRDIYEDDVDVIRDVYIEDQVYIPWQERWEEMSDNGFFK